VLIFPVLKVLWIVLADEAGTTEAAKDVDDVSEVCAKVL
jgi:hypothetical protein